MEKVLIQKVLKGRCNPNNALQKKFKTVKEIYAIHLKRIRYYSLFKINHKKIFLAFIEI